jgi:hypothetical protein
MPEPKPKPPPNADDPEQSQRFIDMAREVEADERPEAFGKAWRKVMPSGSPPRHIEKTKPS